jgi:hypothetical protein
MQAVDAVPEVVFVPASPVTHDGVQDVILETRKLRDGVVALPAFSSLGTLVATLGDCQPWVALPLTTVQQLLWRAGLGTIALDPSVGRDAWRWSQQDLADLTRRE